MAIPVAAQFKACICGRSLAAITGSNPAVGGGHKFVSLLSVVYCQVCLCVGLITRPEKSCFL